MLESVLFLIAGILFIMLGLIFLNKKIGIFQTFFFSAAIFMLVYTIAASVLIAAGMFSVNRTLMLIAALAFMAAAVIAFINRKIKPSVTMDLREHIFPILICVIFAVISVRVVSDGFFSVDSVIGVSQAKAVNLASSNETSPLEAQYLTLLDENAQNSVNQANSQLKAYYENYSIPLTALLAMGTYFFGYRYMLAIFIIPACSVIYLCFTALSQFTYIRGRKKIITESVGTVLIAAFLMVILAIGTGCRDDIAVSSDLIDDIDDIVSSYDIVILDKNIQNELYIPIASVTQAKVYPEFDEIGNCIEQVKDRGERVYYLTGGKLPVQELEEDYLYMKNVYQQDGLTLYRNLNFYKTHETFDYSALTRGVLTVIFMILAIICIVLIVAGIFDYMDNALNIALSTSVAIGLYGIISWMLITAGGFTVVYAAAVTMAVSLAAFALSIALGARPRYRYEAWKSIGIIVGLVLAVYLAENFISDDLYARYRTLGSNQMWALKYVYDSSANLSGIKQVPFISSIMALFGSVFGIQQMLIFLPVGIVGAATMVLAAVERILKPLRSKKVFHVVLNIILVVVIAAGMQMLITNIQSKKTIAKWSELQKYAAAIESDDAVAVQKGVYDIYALPIEIMTNASYFVKSDDYEDAAKQMDGYGKDTFYLTQEDLDPTYDRVNVAVHTDSYYLYKDYEYLTKRGIYSVDNSVVQGFHMSDLSGMAWTSDDNSFIQCNIPYMQYDTVRLYLGDTVKLDKINIDSIDIEFRENWYKVDLKKLDADNNGKYIDFKMDWTYLVDGNNVFYFHCMAMWSPLIYGDKDTRVMGFPFHYIQFLKLEDTEEM